VGSTIILRPAVGSTIILRPAVGSTIILRPAVGSTIILRPAVGFTIILSTAVGFVTLRLQNPPQERGWGKTHRRTEDGAKPTAGRRMELGGGACGGCEWVFLVVSRRILA